MGFGGREDVKEGISALKKKLDYLKREARRAGIEADVSGFREFAIQTILSRGDRKVAQMLEGASYRKFGEYLQPIDPDSLLPWDFIDHGYRKTTLLKEYEKIKKIL